MIFNVPQFIDVEDKIVGPFTAKQLGYLAGGGVILFILWTVLDTSGFIVASMPIALLAGALAFYKPNGRTFSYLLGSMFSFFLHPKMYVWRKNEERTIIKKAPVPAKKNAQITPRKTLNQEKLDEISALLNKGR
jgi:hypothetical protein